MRTRITPSRNLDTNPVRLRVARASPCRSYELPSKDPSKRRYSYFRSLAVRHLPANQPKLIRVGKVRRR
jgi:hypothetical protein